MKTYKIHLIRHGLAKGAIEGRYIGHTDVSLTDDGRKQLEEMRDDYGYPAVSAVLSSPLKRCTQTAEIIFPDLKPLVFEDLIEYDFGEFEGQTAEELQSDPAFGAWLKGGGESAPPYGESNEDFSIRVRNCFEMIVDGLLQTGVDNAAIITHGGVMMTILSAFGLPERPMTDWVCPNGCGYTIRITPMVWSSCRKFEVIAWVPDMPDETEENFLVEEEDDFDYEKEFDPAEFAGFYSPSENKEQET
ncbi:MAG: histidine phosphatase family protein [Ruminococcaceae bacterium]|nr:histidine phosphatase family protein [Oscillospiraceae bacterium]